MGFTATPAAGVILFFIAWLTMILWGTVAPEMDGPTVSYSMAMLTTIAVWLILAQSGVEHHRPDRRLVPGTGG